MARHSQGATSTGRQALIMDDGPIELGAPQVPSDGSAVEPPGDPPLPTDAAPAPAKDDSVSESAQVIAKAVRYVKAKRGGDLAAVILAGSAARDAMTSHSDVDLLVLVLGADNSHELVRVLSRIVELRYLGASGVEHLRFISQRDHVMGEFLQQAFTATDLADQLATARHIADHLFKDIPAPARID